jgi:hypothetical protein
MNRTILSLAIIKAHWDKDKDDYIDSFIPLMAWLLKEKNYTEVDFTRFQKDFQERYGLFIPINAFVTIFNRAKKKNIVFREQGKIYVRIEGLSNYDLSISSAEVGRKFKHLTGQIKDFAKSNYDLEVKVDEIENALLAFLKEHDLDILFAAKDKSVLPEVKSKNKLKYVISTFSIHAFESDPQLFQFLVDISVGHALSGAILYSKSNTFSGKLKDLNIYLDTPIILDFLGFNGKYKERSVKELIDILNEEKANICILNITRGEVDSILFDCQRWLEKGSYDIERASRVLKYCHRKGLTAIDVEQVIVSLDRFLSGNRITSTQTPSYSEIEFVIDEALLEETIYKTYDSVIDNFDKERADSRGSIKRDVQVLSGIYRFRRGYKPKSIKDSKALFITSNTALAFASRRFETMHNGTNFTIPTCLTDVFLGTIIWLQSPQRVETINSKRFIADCYSAIQPSDALIKKYLAEIEKLKAGDKISSDDYYLLRSHRVSLSLLESKSMGDPDAIDATSTEEILDGIIQSIKEKEAKILADEIRIHQETKKKLAHQEEKVQTIQLTLEGKAENISIFIGKLLFGFSFLIVAFCLFANLFPEYFNLQSGFKVVLWVLIGIITLMNLSTGFNLWGMKDKIVNSIKVKVLNWLKK